MAGQYTGNRLTEALDAFQISLSQEQQDRFKAMSEGTPVAQDVVHLLSEIDKENSARRSRVWAKQVRGILDSVQQYCSIVDTFVQANPAITSLVWGSVKLVILAAANFSDYFEALSQRFEQLGKYCPRLDEYKKLFGDSKRVRVALSDFYAIVVVFCTKALKVIQERSIIRFAKSLARPFKDEFGPVEANLTAARHEVDEEIRLASDQKAHDGRELQQLEYGRNERHRSDYLVEVQRSRLHRSLQQKESTANRLFRSLQLVDMAEQKELRIQKLVKEEERNRLRLRQMVCAYDYTWNLRIARRKRCPNTGLWLLERPEFKGWLEGTLSNCLWCCGTVGFGKTILTGHVIDHLVASCEEGRVIAYYFFDFRRKESLSTLTFLRSILHQLLRVDNITPEIQRRIEAIFFGTTGTREPEVTELQELATEICASSIQEELLFVIDGIDEANREILRGVLQFLERIQSCPRVKIFAAGQPEVFLASFPARWVTIYITAQELEKDIRTFIDVQAERELGGILSPYGPELIDTVKDVLSWKAQGMFLWVDLQIKGIRDACEDDGSADRVAQILDCLPHDIQEIYSRALQKLLGSGGQRTEMAGRVFRWVVCARRPMNISELEEAITIEAGQKSWKEPPLKLSWPTLSKLCGNLLASDPDGSIFLAHHSILQFLQSCISIPLIGGFHFQLDEAERYLGDTCMTYLNFADFETSLTTTPDSRTLQPLARPLDLGAHVLPGLKRLPLPRSSRLQQLSDGGGFSIGAQLRTALATSRKAKSMPQFALLDYCRTNWYHHCAVFSQEDEKHSELQELVLRKELPFHWRPWDPPNCSSPYPHWAVFHWAVCHAHVPLFQIWKKAASEREARGSWKRLWETDGERLFCSACSSGHVCQVEMLLEGSSPRPADALSNALVHAALSGHLPILERLFRENPDINAQVTKASGRGMTPMQAAADGGHLAVVERLLQEGAIVNAAAVDYNGRTALQAAAEGGHLAVVERLLQESANVNAAAGHTLGRTALHAAAACGHLAVVEQLLQENANVNAAAAHEFGTTALQAAADGGHLAVVGRLREAGGRE